MYNEDMADFQSFVEGSFQKRVRYRGTGNQHVDSFLYYGTFGLADPKAPFVDAPAIRASSGMTYGKSLFAASMIGFLSMGAVGWLFDPSDKREGGVWESDVFQSAWQPIKEGWALGREAETPWWL